MIVVCVYMGSVSSLCGGELVVGVVWGGECRGWGGLGSPSPSHKNNAMKNGKTYYRLPTRIISLEA